VSQHDEGRGLRRLLRRLVLRLLGRPLRCGVCHGLLAERSIPFVTRRGGLTLLGGLSQNVRVDWLSGNQLQLRHMQASDCLRRTDA
jgi:hypothetical protein